MHPVIQLTVAVTMVVIASRMWHPLLFWLAGLFLLLGIIKLARRIAKWIKIKSGNKNVAALIHTGFAVMLWVAVATLADYLNPNRISAVSIVLCFFCAFIFIVLLLFVADISRRYLHRR